MKYPQNPSGMLFMQLLRKRTREVKPLLAWTLFLACLLTLIFPFWKCVQQTILFQLYGKKLA